ncbi:MAG: CoA pyrophosphatase [Vicinamibacterales bacterium]
MSFDELLTRVSTGLARPLPGANAHARMAPRVKREWPPGFNLAHVRHAASLLLLAPHGNSAKVILTVRAHALERHGGQVSMPGGVIEPDESFADAAVREAHEEIGLDPAIVQVLGALTPIDIMVSGFRMHPIVASVAALPTLRPDPREVARILEVPLDDLRDQSRVVWGTRQREGRGVEFPAFPFDGAEIWGATAMALAEFMALLD